VDELAEVPQRVLAVEARSTNPDDQRPLALAGRES
jgi:hypothetical protein